MHSQMGKTSMRKYHWNTGGGYVNFKIVYKIIEEYNFWAKQNAPTLTIHVDYLHANGILDPQIMMSTKERKKLPSFPNDIK